MAGNQVVVSILGNAKSLQSALGSSQTGLAKFGKVAAAASAAAAAGLAALGTKAVKSASELEQNMGGMQSVFKGASGQMEKWAAKAASSVGLAKSEYAGLATVLGSQLKNMGVAQDQLAGQTNKLVGLGADLAAQFGGSTSDAVGALSSLLRGERDPIERYGVSINEAAIQAKMAEMGLSGLSGEAEKNAKLQATLALLTQQTADAQGAFSRESTTLAGAQQRVAAGAENLFATLGTSLLPAVTGVTAGIGALLNRMQESTAFAAFTARLTAVSNGIADFLFGLINGTTKIDVGGMFQSILDGAVSGVQKAATWLSGGGASTIVNSFVSSRTALLDAGLQVFPAILDALMAAVPAIVTGLLSLVTQLAMTLTAQAPTLLAGAVALFQSLLSAVLTVLPGLLTLLGGLLPVIVESLLAMIPGLLETAVALFTAIVEAIPVILPPLLAAIVDMLPSLLKTLLGLIPAILDAAISLFTSLVKALPVILPLLIGAILDLLPRILSTVIGMIPKLIDAAISLFTGIVSAIPQVLPLIIRALIDLAPKMVGTLIGLVPQLVQAGVNLVAGLVKGLWDAAASVGSALLEIVKGAVGDFLGFLGIHSPSTLFASYGKNLVQGLVQGLDRNGGLVDRSLDGLAGRFDGFSPTLAAPELAGSAGGSLAGAGAGGAVYNVYVNALNPTAETGRVIVQSIRDYEHAGGRL
ncbi:phage tail protein [Agromyces archimandritae]|uniref:Tape measure protein n=1 Tax=Agromyces archimandritae TaxID=2781962 RepID=A0A975FKB4_9MICO|nr:hypothetical protein [Agromyces archimandritae]QTX04110.1 hypothetical protein G127AT_12525 [Agromyces archimandritae]